MNFEPIAINKDGDIERKDIISACRDAGFNESQWKAMTFNKQPYDITCPTIALCNLVKLLTGRDINDR